ncbi:Bro-N domain-containing protein [Maridesulfovibrio sp.]|uniref:BRO-N domain-containing protein n=1 Tax=Maridesulfovibrio sp. TaxID=2795000 RepID=UPI0029C9CA9E|nr:Bro-N domain-containing protein [Maridesulfovibrio sp.]
MSDKIIPFDFGDRVVRVVTDQEGLYWFVAKDVCAALEISNHKDAVSRLDDDERDGVGITDPIGRRQEVLAVSESGLYSLIFKSRKPEAKKFRRWVTSEVLPTLRERGCYALGDDDPESEESASTPSLPYELDKLPRLRPNQRSVALQSAVQVARMNGGCEDDIHRLFFEYCHLLSDVRPGSGLQIQGGDQSMILFREWVERFLKPSAKKFSLSERMVIQATPLYQLYCQWVREQECEPVTIQMWGRWMKFEVNFRHEKRAKGWYFVEWLGDDGPKTIPFSDINIA